jgi:hypothetical protein
MRTATIGNHFENEDRNVSQWDQMDHVLAKLRQLQVNYTKKSVFPLISFHISRQILIPRVSGSWDRLLSIADASLFKDSTSMVNID